MAVELTGIKTMPSPYQTDFVNLVSQSKLMAKTTYDRNVIYGILLNGGLTGG
jgi:hypothetical protein